MLVFEERGETRVPREKLSEKSLGITPKPHWLGCVPAPQGCFLVDVEVVKVLVHTLFKTSR